MKQIVLLGMVLWLGLFNTVSAKEFNEPRWKTIYSDARVTLKLDMSTVSYDAQKDMAEAWMAWLDTTKDRQMVVHYSLLFGKSHVRNEEGIVRKEEGMLYKPGSDGAVGRMKFNYGMLPSDVDNDKVFWNTVKQVADRDAKKAAYDKKKREAMWVEWKQRWEEDEQRRQERMNSSVLRIHRNLDSKQD